MPNHDIIDNRDEKLIDHIRQILPGSQSARFAVGYFFLSGLEAVADQLANVRELRLLIGNTSSRETIEQIAEATAASVGQAAALLDQTEQTEQLVTTPLSSIPASG
jgi:hypothetical protein